MIERVRQRWRRSRRDAVVAADVRRLRRRHGHLFRPFESGDRTALVVSLSDFPYQLKVEGMLAQGLAREGLRPVALVPPWGGPARGYFEVFGMSETVRLADVAEADDEERARRETEALLAGELDVERLLWLTYRDIDIGRHVLATVSRILHEGSLDVRGPRVRALVERTTFDVIRSTLAAERLLDRLQPELVLFNERNYASEAPISDLALARGINVVQFVSAMQDDGLVFKRFVHDTRRVHPRSLSPESWEAVRTMSWGPQEEAAVDEELAARYGDRWALTRRNQEWTRPRAPEELVRELALDPAKPTAVVFSHVLWDANMFYGEDIFDDQEQWLVETMRAACRNDAVNWIVKLHPANVWKLRREGRSSEELDELTRLRDRIGELPQHVAVLPARTDVATSTIFELARWGVTIRGSVGIELPCLGVPVLTAGTGFYSGLGFTVDSASAVEYLARLASIQEIPRPSAGEVELARRHAYALFRLRPLRFTSFSTLIRPLREMGHPLDHDLTINLRSRDELVRAKDLGRFGEWAVRSRALDYLAPPAGGVAGGQGYDGRP